VTAGNGRDSISATHSAALIKVGKGNDTVFASGGATVMAGHGHDKLVFGFDSANPHGNLVLTGGAAHDTFQYNYSDSAHNDGSVNQAKGHAPIEVTVSIHDFQKHGDVLAFHDTDGGIGFTRTQVNAHAAVTDGGLHHNVTIVMRTETGAAAGTIVLKGIGTAGHHLNSIDALVAHGYHLSFS
jgi:hypothetical protein